MTGICQMRRGGGGGRSRSKGARVERIVVDWLRQLGYTSFRVPLSGASMGDKGDIKVEIPNTRYGDRPMDAKFLYGEAKARNKAFSTVYGLFDKLRGRENTLALEFESKCFVMTYNFDSMGLIGGGNALEFKTPRLSTGEPKIMSRILKFEEWLKGADFLIIKGDYKPLLFIRYY